MKPLLMVLFVCVSGRVMRGSSLRGFMSTGRQNEATAEFERRKNAFDKNYR